MTTVRSNKDGFTALAELSTSASTLELFEDLIIDFSSCSFFDANMAAPLNAVLKRVNSEFNEVKIVGLRPDVERILRKNEFLCEYGFQNLLDSNQTTLPYRCFGLEHSHNFSDYLSEHLSGKGIPTMSVDLDRRFRQSIFEIFQNCATHSNTTTGISVCGQFFPQLNRLDLTISDGGVGIRTNARRVVRKDIGSVEAIRWAIQEGNTSKTGSEPGGFGLKLLQEFVELNRGKVQIASRLGYYEFDGSHQRFEKLPADFRGTTVNLEINTNDKSSYSLKSEVLPQDIF
nr:ATP-binding protein [Achromobacter insolitus]